MSIKRVAGLALVFLTALAGTALAAVPDEIVRDFKPISGYVIMPVQGEFLIDLDAGKGVAVGDLFSVVKPGEKIIHPVTKEVLGTLDEVKGVLQVTRVKSGYSYGRPLGEAKGIERGDVVRRFENVSATLWDYTGQGAVFAAELSAALPNLAWPEYSAAQAGRPQVPAAPGKGGSDLLFILRHDGLEVRDAAFQVLHAYPLPEGITPSPKVAAVPLPVPAVSSPPAAAPAPYQLEEPPAEAPAGIRYEAKFPGFISLGNLPGVTTMASLVRDGERNLLATTDGKDIRVFSVNGGLVPIAGGDMDYIARILAVAWWRPAPGEPWHLAVTAWNDRRLESALFALQGERLVLKAEHLPYILGAFDRDGDGMPELLLGQDFDLQGFFSNRISQLQPGKEGLRATELKFKLPPKFTVQGSLFADLTGDGRPETVLVRDGTLRIFDGAKELYASPRQSGGTLSVAIYETNPGAKDSAPGAAAFEVPPVAVDLDGDGVLELVAISSKRPVLNAAGLSPGVDESWLAVYKYRDGMFVKGTIGEEMELPLQGLAATPERVLFVATEPVSFFGSNGSSHLLAFPRAQ